MIERARGLGLENAEWIVGDGSTLRPLADASVDVCVSHVVFQHIPDPCVTLSYVREMGRVLKPGGRAAFQVSNDPAAHRSRRRGLWRALRRLAGRAPHGEAEAAWLGSAVDLSDLRAVAEQAGMEVVRMFGEGKQFCLIGAFKPVSSPPRGSSRTRAG
jgi:ubiquinone/menaquinone biosynthesis C-methylase UbiE